MMVAFVITLPYTLFQAWSFVRPASTARKAPGHAAGGGEHPAVRVGIVFCYFLFQHGVHFINQIAPKSISWRRTSRTISILC